MIRQTYFISTGRKSAMFTLRVLRTTDDPNVNMFMRDHYVCNLANAGEAGEAIALEKARAYADAMRDRIGETDEFKVEFGGFWDEPANLRRGKLSVADTNALENIEAGIFPFGKHRGAKIDEAPQSYVLFFADKLKEFEADPAKVVMAALAAACAGVALEKGYIEARDEARVARAAADALSQHVGTIGEDGKLATLNANASFLRRLQGIEFDAVEALARSDARAASKAKAEAKAKADTTLTRLAADVARIGAALPWAERSGFIAAFSEMVRKSIEDQKKR